MKGGTIMVLQVHGSMPQFERNPPLGSSVQSASPPLGPYQDFVYGFDPRGFSNPAMGGLQPNQGQLPVLPNHQFPKQHICATNAGSLMLPQVEPNAEPLSGSSSTLPNSSALYHQVTSMKQM